MNKRPLGSYKCVAGTWANQCLTGMFRRAPETSSRRAWIRLRKSTSSGADGEPRHHSVLTTAMAAMMSTGAMAQSTVVTTGTAHAAAVQQALVERLNGGWRITEKDRTVLQFMENRSCGPQMELDVPVEHLSARGARAQTSRLHKGWPKPKPAALPGGTCASAREGVLTPPIFVEHREKLETFRTALSCQGLNAVAGAKDGRRSRIEDSRGDRMDDVPLKAPRRRFTG